MDFWVGSYHYEITGIKACQRNASSPTWTNTLQGAEKMSWGAWPIRREKYVCLRMYSELAVRSRVITSLHCPPAVVPAVSWQSNATNYITSNGGINLNCYITEKRLHAGGCNTTKKCWQRYQADPTYCNVYAFWCRWIFFLVWACQDLNVWRFQKSQWDSRSCIGSLTEYNWPVFCYGPLKSIQKWNHNIQTHARYVNRYWNISGSGSKRVIAVGPLNNLTGVSLQALAM